MSISIIGRPDTFTPVFNPIYYYVESSNKNIDGFKYVVDVYTAGTTSRLARYKLFPRPIDGYGVADVNQILATQLSYFFNQNLNGFSTCPENFFNYQLQFGEEYATSWEFDLVGPNGVNTRLTNTGGTAASYVAGDQITVTMKSGATNSHLNGTFNVISSVASFGSWFVTIGVGGTMSASESGSTVYADHRKTVFTNLSGATGTTFNGAISHMDFPTYSSSTYNISSGTTAQFLTNMPDGYRVKLENDMWWNFYSTHTGLNGNRLKIQTDYGVYIYKNPYSATSETMMTVSVGPQNIIDFSPSATTNSGTLPVFKNNSYNIVSTINDGGKLGVILNSSTVYTVDDIVKLNTNIYTTDGLYILSGVTGNYVVIDTPFISGITTGTVSQITDYYNVTLLSSGQTETSETLTVNINRDCFRYDNVELIFIDRLGSFIPANFELQSARKINIERSEYQTILGDLSGNKWTYNSTDRGRNQINTSVVQSLDVRSNWLTEDEANFLEELYSSPIVYIKENGQLWPVIIRTNSYIIQTKNNKKNIQISLTLEYANNDRVQNF